jgi:hypothetical protein
MFFKGTWEQLWMLWDLSVRAVSAKVPKDYTLVVFMHPVVPIDALHVTTQQTRQVTIIIQLFCCYFSFLWTLQAGIVMTLWTRIIRNVPGSKLDHISHLSGVIFIRCIPQSRWANTRAVPLDRRQIQILTYSTFIVIFESDSKPRNPCSWSNIIR